MHRLRASVLVVGDEILGGFVQDTNSGWLAQRLRVCGVPLDRIVTVSDDVGVIATTLANELARSRPRVVFTSGGLGSTPDDLTMAAVASCIGVDLVAEPTIDRHIGQALAWHAEQGMEMNEEQVQALRRMALVPSGAYLLAGAGSVFPGVALDVDGGLDKRGGATVVVLPGVPALLRRIVLEGVEPHLLSGHGRPDHVAEIRHSFPESMLNPILVRLGEELPDLHVGSYPGRECLVRLRGERTSVEAGASMVRDFLDDLERQPGADRLREAWRRRWAGDVS